METIGNHLDTELFFVVSRYLMNFNDVSRNSSPHGLLMFIDDSLPWLHCTGEPGKRKMEPIVAYAQMVKKNGFYLEVIDAQAFVLQIGGTLAFGLEDQMGRIKVLPAQQQWATLLDHQNDIPDIDPKNPNTWLLISCNAMYDPKGPANHWIPGFFKDQLHPDVYYQLTLEALSSLNDKGQKKRAQLKTLQASLDRVSSQARQDPEGQAILQSKISELEDEHAKFLNLDFE